MNKKQFVECILMLEMAYPTFNISESEIALNFWYEEFKNVDIDVFQKSIKDVYRSEKYAPTIATIHEAIMRNYTWHQDSPTKAWAKVKGYVRRYGNKPWSWVFVELRDHHHEPRAFVYALEQLGWKTLVSSQERDLVFMRKDFEEIYKEILEDDNRQKLEAGVLQNERQMLEAERQKILAEQEKKAIAGPADEGKIEELKATTSERERTYQDPDEWFDFMINGFKEMGTRPPVEMLEKEREAIRKRNAERN